MSKTDSTMTVQFTWAEKFNILKPYFSDRFMEQVKNVWLIITYLVLFQIIVLGLPIVDSLMIGVGIGIVIVGIALAFIPKVNQLHTYEERSRALQRDIDQTIQEEQRLKEYQHRFSTDPTFVERIAHEVGYAHEDETIFYFPEETDER